MFAISEVRPKKDAAIPSHFIRYEVAEELETRNLYYRILGKKEHTLILHRGFTGISFTSSIRGSRRRSEIVEITSEHIKSASVCPKK